MKQPGFIHEAASLWPDDAATIDPRLIHQTVGRMAAFDTVERSLITTHSYEIAGETYTGSPLVGEHRHGDTLVVGAVDASQKRACLSRWLTFRLIDANSLETDGAMGALFAEAAITASSRDKPDVADDMRNTLHASPEWQVLRRFVDAELTTYYNAAKMSAESIAVHPMAASVEVPSDSPIIDQMLKPWSPTYYAIPREPIVVGELADPELFGQAGFVVRANGMAVKLPGDNTLRIPEELAQFVPAIEQVADHQYSINPDSENYFAYVSVKQSVLSPGQAQGISQPEVHVDGVQGKRYPTKIVPEQTYIVSNGAPTRIYVQPFKMGNPDTEDYRPLFAAQADAGATMLTKANTIYQIDPYTVHQATFAEEEMQRTLLRVEFSKKRYDSVGDTINPALAGHTLPDGMAYPWQRAPRPHPRDLAGYKHRQHFFSR